MNGKRSFNVILIKHSDLEEKIVKSFLENFSKEKEINLILKASFDLELEDDLLIPGLTGKKLGLIRVNKFLNQIKEKDINCKDYIIISITNDILENYVKNKLLPQEISYLVIYYNDNLIFTNSFEKDLDPKIYLEIISKQDQIDPNQFFNHFVSKVKKIKPEGFEEKDTEVFLQGDIEMIQDSLQKGFIELIRVFKFFEYL